MIFQSFKPTLSSQRKNDDHQRHVLHDDVVIQVPIAQGYGQQRYNSHADGQHDLARAEGRHVLKDLKGLADLGTTPGNHIIVQTLYGSQI